MVKISWMKKKTFKKSIIQYKFKIIDTNKLNRIKQSCHDFVIKKFKIFQINMENTILNILDKLRHAILQKISYEAAVGYLREFIKQIDELRYHQIVNKCQSIGAECAQQNVKDLKFYWQ